MYYNATHSNESLVNSNFNTTWNPWNPYPQLLGVIKMANNTIHAQCYTYLEYFQHFDFRVNIYLHHSFFLLFNNQSFLFLYHFYLTVTVVKLTAGRYNDFCWHCTSWVLFPPLTALQVGMWLTASQLNVIFNPISECNIICEGDFVFRSTFCCPSGNHCTLLKWREAQLSEFLLEL